MKKGLLLGAGFSHDLGMPLAVELTDALLGTFTDERGAYLVELLSRHEPYGQDRPINKAALRAAVGIVLDYKRRRGQNYEELLNEIQTTGDFHQKTQSDTDSYNYVFSVLWDVIRRFLRAYQHESYAVVYPVTSRWFSGFRNFLPADEATWIFSLNHDLFVECLAIDLGIPITYGDAGEIFFPISNADMGNQIRFTTAQREGFTKESPAWISGRRGINLVRLHGGLSEHHYHVGDLFCNPSLHWKQSSELIAECARIEAMAYYHHGQPVGSGKERFVTRGDGQLEVLSRTMLAGGRKYSATTDVKKGEEKLQLFDAVLKDLDELTIAGYGFGDAHVNHRLSNAMVLNPGLRTVTVDPARHRWPEFLDQFNYGFRLRAATSGAAQWISYVADDKWDVSQMEALQSIPERLEVKKRIRTQFQCVD